MFKAFELLAISAASLLPLAAGAAECEEICQKQKADEYFSLLSEVYKGGSKVSDIDTLFGIFSSGVRYEHLNYQASFNRDEWKAAFVGNHERGAYRNEPNQFVKVESYIHGKGHVAVSYSYVSRKEDGSLQPAGDQQLLALFSLTNGKFSSVKEHW